MPRMRILTTQEQKDFDFPPVFNHADRKQVFSFPKSLLQAALALRTSSNQIGFLLMCGYFKASKRFFLSNDFHLRDIEAVARILNKSPSDFIPSVGVNIVFASSDHLQKLTWPPCINPLQQKPTLPTNLPAEPILRVGSCFRSPLCLH